MPEEPSLFWRDAIDPKNGAKIIAVYPSGSTVDFTQTAKKTTEGRDRAVERVGNLRGALSDLIASCLPQGSQLALTGTKAPKRDVLMHARDTLKSN